MEPKRREATSTKSWDAKLTAETTGKKDNLDRSTSRGLLRRLRSETLGPKRQSIHLDPPPSTGSRGRSAMNSHRRTGRLARRILQHSPRETGMNHPFRKTSRAQRRTRTQAKQRKPSHGADRNRTTGEARAAKLGCLQGNDFEREKLGAR
ncbi:hypothetical protein ISN44_As06g045770 [Arabidopsis suecica]|uniref:Uncharacterized protein n=1 Tax=Arabidopsis suecica TaxID=45249 RepID=A0A8T2CLY5_ARASU|nr:hypothetical protein ISN44_As06g045770 [Arabidopsis suecica]